MNWLNLCFRVLSNFVPITILQWDFTGDLLLIADENGCVKIFKTKDYVLNEWTLLSQSNLQGEHILAAAFFHSGKKVSKSLVLRAKINVSPFQICLNSEKKDSCLYTEKFQNVKFACSVKQFGGRPANGALLLTTTGMLAAILLPQFPSQGQVIMATESLGPTRIHIETADICYGKSNYFK